MRQDVFCCDNKILHRGKLGNLSIKQKQVEYLVSILIMSPSKTIYLKFQHKIATIRYKESTHTCDADKIHFEVVTDYEIGEDLAQDKYISEDL